MKLINLLLKNFRNYDNEYIEFDNNTNIISGPNAQGKTNIVEAIYILSTLKSFRNSKLVDCIKEGKDSAEIVANFISPNKGKYNIRFIIKREGENEFYFNSNLIKKKSEMFGYVYSIIFSPDELRIIKGSPDIRREFLDTDISQVSKVYYSLIEKYEYVLTSRNKLLKMWKQTEENEIELSVFDEQLAIIGSQISISRENFIKKINNYAYKIMNVISGGKEKLKIEYITLKGENRKDKTDNFIKILKDNWERDREVGYTTCGIHRDELKFYINNVEVKPYASQGQQRSVVLALKIAELEVMSNEKEIPILLLDDVFSELDNIRQKFLFNYLKEKQIIITSTTVKNKPNYKFLNIRVKNGKVKSINKN